ncbi:glycosyltransferase [Rhodococcus sp. WMMA185]|uniref:glycosyltransferase n=1 Tax=Rhodococcus sp. WMMA185 TaxID=679318 RepID=UPI000878600E|nr:glycosyltransferase [Rhodococcus sp. WMMA185]
MSLFGPCRYRKGASVDPDLSVVIPAHNSAAVIEQTVRRLADHLSGHDVEIIVVENGSSDDTFAICTRLAENWTAGPVSFRVLQSSRGMGNALRAGARASRGAHVLLTADDLPFGFDDLDGVEKFSAEDEGRVPLVAIGSKAHPDSHVRRGILRGILTRGFAVLRRAILGMRTGDPQGTVFMDGELIRGLVPDLAEPGFLFTTELVHLVEQLGIVPAEVPVRLSEDHSGHGTRINRTDVLAMGMGLFRLRARHGDRGRAVWSGSTPRS